MSETKEISKCVPHTREEVKKRKEKKKFRDYTEIRTCDRQLTSPIRGKHELLMRQIVYKYVRGSSYKHTFLCF